MNIVCLGWGSLIWDPRDLRLREGTRAWHRDGPEIPVEFARQSRDKRMTLVLVPAGKTVPVLWAELDFSSVEEARSNLTEREWENGDPHVVCGLWTKDTREEFPHADAIAKWALEKGIEGVLWTRLGPKFRGEERVPSQNEVLDYLESLSGKDKDLAEEYVRRTPRQVVTPYRATIESSLGWTYEGSRTDPNIQ